MKSLRFGIEIETIGMGRAEAAEAIKKVTDGTVRFLGGQYDAWSLTMPDGREWKMVRDASLSSYNHAEVVSPILGYEDLPILQEVVRSIRTAGAKVDASCGIHIHVDASSLDSGAVCRLVKLVNKQEPLIEAALGIAQQRLRTFCKRIEPDLVRTIDRRRPADLRELNRVWYGRENTAPAHYDHTRYHGVNLHSLWYRGTVEFRWFEGTLHAGKIKAYIQFVLALVAKAKNAKAASSRKRVFNPATAKYDFRVFLLHLGLIGDEFKTARLHLMELLAGSSAWKNGRPAAA